LKNLIATGKSESNSNRAEGDMGTSGKVGRGLGGSKEISCSFRQVREEEKEN